MKNLTYILVLLLVIAGCKNANVANTQEHINDYDDGSGYISFLGCGKHAAFDDGGPSGACSNFLAVGAFL